MIYCVEDDAGIRNLIVYTLGMTGLTARGFESPAEFWQAMHGEMPELVLLDVMLPGESGFSVLRQLRQLPETRSLPVMMVTARDAESEVVQGLELGADDYIAKPFAMMELIARIKAVLRRSSAGEPLTLLEYGGIRMDAGAHTVEAGGRAISLTLKEFDLLRILMENAERLMERGRLIEGVWSADYTGADHTLDTHIQTLRSKLGACGAQIQTVYGCGYRLRSTEKKA